MTYEFLPQEEPGKPLVTLPPGFTESVMQRIADYERRQRRRWATAIALTALCLVGGAFALSARRFDRPPAGFPGTQAGPVTPVVKPASAQRPAPPQPALPQNAEHQNAQQQPAPPQNAVKHARPAAPQAGHDHPVANAVAEAHPEEVSLTLDGKAYRCPADILRPRGSNVHNAGQVYDGKPGQVTAGILSHCRPDPAPRE
jgi:hypothetical protein